MRKIKIGIQLAWLNDGKHANYIGDAGVADAWAKYLRRRGDIESVEVFGGDRMQNDCDVLINFHPGLPTHARAKNILYSQNAWSEEQQPGGTVGVFNAVKDRYQGYLFPSEKLRQLCGGEGATTPFAADPEVFTYQPDEKYDLPVTFCGSDIRGDGLNNQYLVPAIPLGLKIWGGPYRSPELQAVHQGRLPEGELPKLYSSSRCNLNIHIKGHSEMEVVNSRIYECLACGGNVLSDYHYGMLEFSGLIQFTEGGAELTKSLGELAESKASDLTRTNRRKFILTNHTWEHRMTDLMAYLKGILQ